MKLSNNTILITGGGTGIGLALAERFAELKNKVIICGRRQAVLDKAAAKVPSLVTHACDVSTASGREELFQWVSAEHPAMNVLVNNAGIQQWMNIVDADFFERAMEEIAINIEAPVHLAALFLKLPSLTTIVNITSGLAFSPLTKTPVYSATKAFLHSFTLSLRHLVRTRNVEVIELIPPALNTDLGGKGLHDYAPPVSEFVDAAFSQLAEGNDVATWGFSDAMIKAGPEELRQAFARMNP